MLWGEEEWKRKHKTYFDEAYRESTYTKHVTMIFPEYWNMIDKNNCVYIYRNV